MKKGMQQKPQRHARPVESAPGPKPQYLKIEGDWRAAVKRAIRKKKPLGGWPK